MDFKATLLDSDILSVHLLCFASLMCHVKWEDTKKQWKKNCIETNAQPLNRTRCVLLRDTYLIYYTIAYSMSAVAGNEHTTAAFGCDAFFFNYFNLIWLYVGIKCILNKLLCPMRVQRQSDRRNAPHDYEEFSTIIFFFLFLSWNRIGVAHFNWHFDAEQRFESI